MCCIWRTYTRLCNYFKSFIFVMTKKRLALPKHGDTSYKQCVKLKTLGHYNKNYSVYIYKVAIMETKCSGGNYLYSFIFQT